MLDKRKMETGGGILKYVNCFLLLFCFRVLSSEGVGRDGYFLEIIIRLSLGIFHTIGFIICLNVFVLYPVAAG